MLPFWDPRMVNGVLEPIPSHSMGRDFFHSPGCIQGAPLVGILAALISQTAPVRLEKTLRFSLNTDRNVFYEIKVKIAQRS